MCSGDRLVSRRTLRLLPPSLFDWTHCGQNLNPTTVTITFLSSTNKKHTDTHAKIYSVSNLNTHKKNHELGG